MNYHTQYDLKKLYNGNNIKLIQNETTKKYWNIE